MMKYVVRLFNSQSYAFFLLVETHLPFSKINGTGAGRYGIYGWNGNFSIASLGLSLVLCALQVLRHYRYYNKY